MAQDREIRNRIKTIRNIGKVTKTMQMISAARMKKAIARWQETYPYSDEIGVLVKRLSGMEIDGGDLAKQTVDVKSIGVVIVAPTKGFVGSLVARQTAAIVTQVRELKTRYPEADFSAIGIHKLAGKIASASGLRSQYVFANEVVLPDYTNMAGIYFAIKNGFISGEFDQIYLCYARFETATRQQVFFEPLLPISMETLRAESTDAAVEPIDNMIVEPGTKTLLAYLLNEYVEKQVNSAIMASNASEHSTRMISMKNATDNAIEMAGNLTLKYNKSRQAQITQQVVEVSAGMES